MIAPLLSNLGEYGTITRNKLERHITDMPAQSSISAMEGLLNEA